MKIRIYVYYLLFMLLGLTSCYEQEIVNIENKTRKLVIITDFQKGSSFSLTLLGSVERSFPEVEIEFIQSPSFDIYEASYLLETAAGEYPKGTYFAVFVGTGVDDKFIFFESEGNRYICCDNGLASRVANKSEWIDFYYVENEELLGGKREDMAYTEFYKRILFALLSDTKPHDFGNRADDPVMIEIKEPAIEGNSIIGQILYRDNFGNCITNIPAELVSLIFTKSDIISADYNGSKFFLKYGSFYSSVNTNENVCFINNDNTFELAVNYGNFSSRYSISAGAIIKLSKASINIAVLMYNNSDVAEDIKNGMIARIEELGFKQGAGINVSIRSAGGNVTRLNSLVSDLLVNAKPDVFVSISTPASQVAMALVPDNIPLIFTYVTDPQSAGLLDGRKNISGLSDKTNFVEYLDFVGELLPDMKTAGSFYSSNESNSVFAKSQMEKYKSFYHYDIIFEDVPAVNYIYNAYSSLKVNEMQALLIAANNTCSEAMSDIALLCNSDKIPLIGDSFEHCASGALASISVDYDKLASATGDMISMLLLGISLDKQPIKYFHTDLIAINKKTAQQISYQFPKNILDNAKLVYE